MDWFIEGEIYRKPWMFHDVPHSMMGVSCKLSLKIWASHAPLLSQYTSSTLKPWATRLSHGLMAFKMPWYSVMSSNEKKMEQYIGIYWDILGYIGIYWDVLGILGVSLGQSYSSVKNCMDPSSSNQWLSPHMVVTTWRSWFHVWKS